MKDHRVNAPAACARGVQSLLPDLVQDLRDSNTMKWPNSTFLDWRAPHSETRAHAANESFMVGVSMPNSSPKFQAGFVLHRPELSCTLGSARTDPDLHHRRYVSAVRREVCYTEGSLGVTSLAQPTICIPCTPTKRVSNPTIATDQCFGVICTDAKLKFPRRLAA